MPAAEARPSEDTLDIDSGDSGLPSGSVSLGELSVDSTPTPAPASTTEAPASTRPAVTKQPSAGKKQTESDSPVDSNDSFFNLTDSGNTVDLSPSKPAITTKTESATTTATAKPSATSKPLPTPDNHSSGDQDDDDDDDESDDDKASVATPTLSRSPSMKPAPAATTATDAKATPQPVPNSPSATTTQPPSPFTQAPVAPQSTPTPAPQPPTTPPAASSKSIVNMFADNPFATGSPGSTLPRPVTHSFIIQASIGYQDTATGLDLPSPLQLFLQYDKDRSLAVDKKEFMQMLFDLDGLKDIPRHEMEKYCEEQFNQADLNHDGIISIDEFYYYFYKELCFKFPVLRTGVNPGADLFNIFVKYCSSGKQFRCEEMASSQFSKLCRDAKLTSDKVNKADLDILFARAKAETEVLEVQSHRPGATYTTARISYPQFLFALLRLAEKRCSGFQEVVSRIMGNISAIPAASQADLLLFRNTGDPALLAEYLERPRGLPPLQHVNVAQAERLQREVELAKQLKVPGHKKERQPFDKTKLPNAASGAQSTPAAGDTPAPPGTTPQAQSAASTTVPPAASTSTPASGGPAIPSTPEVEEALKTYAATPDARKKWGLEHYGSPEALGLSKVGAGALADPNCLLAVRNLDFDHLMMALKRTFETYNQWNCGANKSAMDKIRFNKSMRDAGLVHESGPLTGALCDAVFRKVLPTSKNHLNFVEYVEALRHVATKMRLSLNEIMERVVLVNAPIPVA